MSNTVARYGNQLLWHRCLAERERERGGGEGEQNLRYATGLLSATSICRRQRCQTDRHGCVKSPVINRGVLTDCRQSLFPCCLECRTKRVGFSRTKDWVLKVRLCVGFECKLICFRKRTRKMYSPVDDKRWEKMNKRFRHLVSSSG